MHYYCIIINCINVLLVSLPVVPPRSINHVRCASQSHTISTTKKTWPTFTRTRRKTLYHELRKSLFFTQSWAPELDQMIPIHKQSIKFVRVHHKMHNVYPQTHPAHKVDLSVYRYRPKPNVLILLLNICKMLQPVSTFSFLFHLGNKFFM